MKSQSFIASKLFLVNLIVGAWILLPDLVGAQSCSGGTIQNTSSGSTVTLAATANEQCLTNSGTLIATGGTSGYPTAIETYYEKTIVSNSGSITLNNNDASALLVPGPTIGGVLNPNIFFQNSGSIVGSGAAVYAIWLYSNSGLAGSILNTGTIGLTGSNSIGIYNYSNTTINSLTNAGAIYAPGASIVNAGTITTFNNLQGGNGSSATTTALTYNNNLPTNYNIIVRSANYYGQLVVAAPSGTTTFGIYSGGVSGVAASTLTKGTYTSVLSGVTSDGLSGARTGNYNGFTWALSNSSGSIWDLIVTGASTADTQQSLVNTASVLQNTFTLQNSVLANSFSYDCTVFGANNVCVSAGGRNTAVSAANGLYNTSALLIAAYRLNQNYRIGAYADQNLSVNNAGSTVNLGNNTPLIGLFGAWNERLDGTGTEVKVSAAYGQKNTTINRQAVGTSEAGTGSSTLNSQGVQATAKYGFAVTDNAIVSPYLGMRYTTNNMGGYTEATSSSVTAPLTYSALNTNATTALAGVGASYRGIPKTTLFASAGVETDTNTSNGSYSATGITGLTPVNFNPNPVKTRPTATVGGYYDILKNQRIGITGIYRQEPFQAVSTTTVLATYTIGL